MVLAIPRRSKPQDRRHGQLTRLAICLAATALLTTGAGAQAAAAPEDEGLSGPDIVIIAEPERNIYEFRQGGELRMVRIEPKIGKPYYLVPRDNTKGYGDLERADMLLPSWVIVEF